MVLCPRHMVYSEVCTDKAVSLFSWHDIITARDFQTQCSVSSNSASREFTEREKNILIFFQHGKALFSQATSVHALPESSLHISK